MKKINYIYFSTLALLLLAVSGCWRGEISPEFRAAANTKGRTEVLFDASWKFHRGDTASGESVDIKDSSWRLLDLPHDWSIEDLPGKESAIDSTAIGGIDAGYLVGGTGWYRKEFLLPLNLRKKHIEIRFDGIYMNSDVWINGHHLGNHPYGYTSFKYDITEFLNHWKKNIIAVRVKNEGRNSRWYSGSGIYRHVWLAITSPVHMDPWNLSVTTPVADSSKAVVKVSAGIKNESSIKASSVVITYIYDPQGRMISQSESRFEIEAGKEALSTTDFNIVLPSLWSPDRPLLYTSATELFGDNKEGRRVVLDRVETHFGIRDIKVSSNSGLTINGKKMLLKGGCMHHDNGPLGSAAFDRAEERRVELMKASGFNAIRCSHNPPSPAFLDACDRLGMMVIDEAFDMWAEPKNPDDYHLYFNDWWKKDVESMVLRDRNHPSIIAWSIGNEIPEKEKPVGAKMAKEISDFVRNIDPSRLVTSAVNNVNPGKDSYFEVLDICGYNYAFDSYVSDHKRVPERVMLATESFPLEAFEYWMGVKDNPWVIGDFVWTGFDYLGEASIGWLGYPHEGSFYPWTHAFCGDIDICGLKRPQSYYRDVLWNDAKTVSLFVQPPVPSFPLNPKKEKWSKWEWHDVVASWNWAGYEGKTMVVEAYSSCQTAELFLNGKSLGKKATNRQNKWITLWDVKYSPGVLEIKGYENNKVVSSSQLRTAGDAVKISLNADHSEIKADGQDLSYISVELTDKDGNLNPIARNLIKFSVEGDGSIIAVGSSDPLGIESFRKPYRKAYHGKCLVIIRAGNRRGIIKLSATSDGIEGKEVILHAI